MKMNLTRLCITLTLCLTAMPPDSHADGASQQLVCVSIAQLNATSSSPTTTDNTTTSTSNDQTSGTDSNKDSNKDSNDDSNDDSGKDSRH